MAAWILAVFCQCLLVLSVWSQLTPLSTFVSPTGVNVRRSGNIRDVTVTYSASSKPRVTWVENYLSLDESTEDLTFTNTFEDTSGTGEALFSFPDGHFYSDPPEISVNLQLEEIHVFFKFNKTILNSDLTYTMDPMYVDIGPNDVLEYTKGEQLQFTGRVRSTDISKYSVHDSDVRLETMDYNIEPPETIQYWSGTQENAENPLACPENFNEGITSSSSLTKSCTLNTTFTFVSGKMTLSVTLKPADDNYDNVFKKLFFNRIFYIKERGQDAPYRLNTLMVQRLPGRLIDHELRRSSPSFTYTAIGYPRPEIRLERGCQHVPGVNTTHVMTSRYAHTVEFQFPPVTDSVHETYVVVAKSGSYEISDFISVKRR